MVPGCVRSCAGAQWWEPLGASAADVGGPNVADAAAADVDAAGARKAPVAVETVSGSTRQDAACGKEALGPCTPGATGQAAP